MAEHGRLRSTQTSGLYRGQVKKLSIGIGLIPLYVSRYLDTTNDKVDVSFRETSFDLRRACWRLARIKSIHG